MTIKTSKEVIEAKGLTPTQQIKEIIHLEATKRGLDERLKELRSSLMDEMVNNDVLTLKTGSYVIVRAKRTTIRINDDAKVKEELEARGHQVITKEIVDRKYMDPIIKDNIDTLEGASKSETEYISIKLNRKAK